MSFTTLVEVLRSRALEYGSKTAFTLSSDDETTDQTVTFAELDHMARGFAAQLQEAGAVGARVLLLYPPGIEFISAFLGCLYAGSIATPSYPPSASRTDRSSSARLLSIIKDATPEFALTTQALEPRVHTVIYELEHSPRCLVLSTNSAEHASAWTMPDIYGDTDAFLQYTSGSTGIPKGVLITHANLLHNLQILDAAVGLTSEDRGVNWLPPYHDMGLIGGLLQPVYHGTTVVLISPVSFLQRPFRWLETISRVRATITGGPNFGYDLCVRRVTEEQKAQLDLSCWRVAWNGAEPIHPVTLEAFEAAFASCGFSPKAWSPCYGLAESTLFVSGGPRGDRPRKRRFDSQALQANQAIEIRDRAIPGRDLASSGPPSEDLRVAIVHPEDRTECAPGTVGEIWVRGKSVALSFWNEPALTLSNLQARLADQEEGPFLRTGDLGFLTDDELFVTGRMSDLLVIQGLSFYPQDIEATVEATDPALRRGASAAFFVAPRHASHLGVICEVERQAIKTLDTEAVIAAIRQNVLREHGVELHVVGLLKTGSIPKTTSGKIQRSACRDLHGARQLETLALWTDLE